MDRNYNWDELSGLLGNIEVEIRIKTKPQQ